MHHLYRGRVLVTSSLSIWRCPHCRGGLSSEATRIDCGSCGASFEVVGGIPDLRVPGQSWIDFSEDLAFARELASRPHPTTADLVRAVFASREDWDDQRINLRTDQILEGAQRLQSDLHGWLKDVARPNEVFLDLGCGAGSLIAAAAARGCKGIGVDVSMTWLVVAKQLIADAGVEPVLAAALGESLPLGDEAVDAVISLDVIEHVSHPSRYLSEIHRVTRRQGRVALSTPNRFSLTAEPHVFVWGVGWLPVQWQASYVRWRSGKSYSDTTLMSSFGLRRLLGESGTYQIDLIVPQVAPEEIQRFSPVKARLAKIYNVLCTERRLRWFFLLFGPFFRLVATKLA